MTIDRHNTADKQRFPIKKEPDGASFPPRRPNITAQLALAFGAAMVFGSIALASCSTPTGPDELFGNGSTTGQGGATASSSSSSSSSSSNGGGMTGSSSSSASSSSTSSSSTSSSSGGMPSFPLCINEVMPVNQNALADETGNFPDWIELHNPTNTPVDLTGWSLTNDLSMPALSVLPAGLTVPAGGFLVLYADNAPAIGPKHLSFTMQAGGGVVGLFAPNGDSATLTYMAAQTNEAIARVPDCCPGDACLEVHPKGTPGKVNVIIPTQIVEVLAAGSVFKYYDLAAAPATWADVGFDDGAWASGASPLGYGDANIVTTIGYGGNANNKYITAWFRTTFNVTGAAKAVSAGLEIMRDDGVRAFINGVEVMRDNLPMGAIDQNTPATGLVQGAEETVFFPFPVDPALLVEGANVLAIELHQQAANTSDAAMDARMSVELPLP